MNQTFDGAVPDGSDTAAAVALPNPSLDADVLPALAAEGSDRSMLVVQYGLAAVAVVCAILLSQAT